MEQEQKQIGDIIVRALQDEAFRQQLIADPKAALKAAGVDVSENITLKVVADTESVRHIVLPAVSGELTDAELDEVAGGGFCIKQDWWRYVCKFTSHYPKRG